MKMRQAKKPAARGNFHNLFIIVARSVKRGHHSTGTTTR